MKVLFVSNYYPPHTRGGYEQWCREVAAALAARHQVCVMTSRGADGALGANDDTEDDGVDVRRILHLEVESGLLRTSLRLLAERAQLEKANLDRTRAVVAEFQPDVAMIWGM